MTKIKREPLTVDGTQRKYKRKADPYSKKVCENFSIMANIC